MRFILAEVKEIYEGEVTEITPHETSNPTGGYGKTIAYVVIGLKTSKGSKQLKLDPSIYEAIQSEKVIILVSSRLPICHIEKP